MSLRFVVMALLSKEPNTGYRLGRLLDDPLGHLWDARLQQIYSELGKLERQGLVEAENILLPNRPTKKIYSLTPAGWEELDIWLAQPAAVPPPRNSLLIRLYCLDRIPRDVVIRRLQEQQDRHESTVSQLRERLSEANGTSPQELGSILALEASLAQTEAQAAWCAKAQTLLGEADQAPQALRAAGA